MSKLTELEHVNVKVFAREPVRVNWADLIPVYHRWIQQQELFGNVADRRGGLFARARRSWSDADRASCGHQPG